MAFIIATSRNTGDLITADIWNQDVVDNPNFLKGAAGQIVFDDGASFAGSVVPILDDTHDFGTDSLRWREIQASQRLQVGGYRVANRREERLTWEDDLTGAPQFDTTTGGAGASVLRGGSFQAVLKVDDNQAGNVRVDQRPAQNSAASNVWNPAKNPYFRIELHFDSNISSQDTFVGLRATPGAAIPGSSEDHVGFKKLRLTTNWFTTSSNGAGIETNIITPQLTTGDRHIVEFYQRASQIEFWVDGVLVETHTVEFPDATMTWEIILVSDGLGAATDTHFTVGEMIVQEDVP